MVGRATIIISAIRVPRCAHADPVNARSPGTIAPAATAIPRVSVGIGADAAAAALAGLAAGAVAAFRARITIMATGATIRRGIDRRAFILLHFTVKTAALVWITGVITTTAVLLSRQTDTGATAVGQPRWANATANNIANFSRCKTVLAASGAICVCTEWSTLPRH